MSHAFRGRCEIVTCLVFAVYNRDPALSHVCDCNTGTCSHDFNTSTYVYDPNTDTCSHEMSIVLVDTMHAAYELAVVSELEDAQSRSCDNLGRVHARMGNYSQAIQVYV